MKFLKNEVVRVLAMVLVLIPALPAWAGNEPIHIGFANPLSGTLSDYGLACRRGTVLAVEELNSAGGIKGRPINLIIKDDKNDPDEAVKLDLELINQGVSAIIGHFTSNASVAAVPVMNNKQMLLISPGATTHTLSGLDDFFLRVVAPHTGMAREMARHAFQECGARTAALVFDIANRAYSETYLRATETAFKELGGKTTVEVPFNSKEGLSPEDIKKLITARPDMIFIVAGALDTALLVQELHKKREKIRIFSSNWAMTREFIENGGRGARGTLFAGTVDTSDDTPRLNAFKKKYLDRFGENPSMAAVLGYDAITALKTGLENASAPTPANIKQAIIAAGVLPGLNGDFPIDQFGDPKRPVNFYILKNNTFQLVE